MDAASIRVQNQKKTFSWKEKELIKTNESAPIIITCKVPYRQNGLQFLQSKGVGNGHFQSS